MQIARTIAIVAGLAVGCSTTNNVYNVTEAGDAGPGTDASDEDAGVQDASADVEAGADADVDAGSDAGDSGVDAGPLNIFQRTDAGTWYQGQPGPNGPAKGNANHAAYAMSDPAGQACMACHTGTFAFGGTVYTDAAGTFRQPNAEVLFELANGSTVRTWADVDGNFWLGAESFPGGIPAGTRVGVRRGPNWREQVAVVTSGDCNGCHNGASRLVVP